ncbi:MAG: hypothetical protein Q9184_002927 [Pyrenodesmia sp. 2 TL-2023]
MNVTHHSLEHHFNKTNKMGNLLCAPVHRGQFDGGDPVVKNLLHNLADEAGMNAKVRRQTYDRRKRREETGSRHNHRDGELDIRSVFFSECPEACFTLTLRKFGLTIQPGTRGEPTRGNGPRDETYHTAPEGPAFDPRGAFSPSGPPPGPRFPAHPPVPPNRYGEYRPHPPGQPRDGMDEDDFPYGGRETRSPPGQRYGRYFFQAEPRVPNGGPSGRGRQTPRRKKSPQGPDGPYMSGGLPEEEEEEEEEEEGPPDDHGPLR